MTEVLEAYNKVDNTLFLNNFCGNLAFGIDATSHLDCKDLHELVSHLRIIQDELFVSSLNKNILKIIREKDVDSYILQKSKTVEEYNENVAHIEGRDRDLTKEEFHLLKRAL